MKSSSRLIKPSVFVVTALVFSTSAKVWADVHPNALFSDNAVLQQAAEAPVWGTAKDGEAVSVEIENQTVKTTAKDGKWMVRLKGLKAGGPFTMTVKGENEVKINNVLVGEVWICSGQSNMERQLGPRSGQQLIVDMDQEAAAANYPEIRHFLVKSAKSLTPLPEVSGSWVVCSPATVKDFSAVGYFFGRDLYKTIKTPIGLLHSSVGGTPAEAWTSHDALQSDPVMQSLVATYEKAQAGFPAALEKYKAEEPQLLEKYKLAADQAQKDGKPAPRKPAPPHEPKADTHWPSTLYNAMIAPLQPYAIKGAIWYQGESNCGTAKAYQTLFPAMITNWRTAWGQGEFPFLFVQIAPYKGNTPELREAQLLTLKKTPNTAMAVTTDCGDANDIHPTHKQPVGARLALAARALAYGEKIEYSGPVYDSMKTDGDHAVVTFKHLGGGLVAKDGELKGFAVAGADKKFVSAKAIIKGGEVWVSGDGVSKPAAVRYGWTNVPEVNLYNKEGLPASPFRTDME